MTESIIRNGPKKGPVAIGLNDVGDVVYDQSANMYLLIIDAARDDGNIRVWNFNQKEKQWCRSTDNYFKIDKVEYVFSFIQ
jgi:hypothetical protein